VRGAACRQNRRADGTYARAAGSASAPALERDDLAWLVRAGAFARLVVPDRFVQQRVVHLGAEYCIGEFQLADLSLFKIHYVDCRHRGYLLDLRTTT